MNLAIGRIGTVALALALGVAGDARSRPAMPDDAAGPTCEAYLPMGPLLWQQRGGDWVDAANRLHGTQPFAAAVVAEGAAPQRVEFDVSALVHRAAVQRAEQVTWMLRAEPGLPAGQVDFHSREQADPRVRPTLELLWADGSTNRLEPEADTFLDCTSAYSLGGQTTLSVRNNRSSLLRFRLPPRALTSPPRSARLVVVSSRQIGGGVRVGIYRAEIPYEQAEGAPRRGLASGFVLDEGITRHPDVFFASGFEEWSWAAHWRDLSVRSHAEVTGSDPEGRFEPVLGRALRVRIPRGEQLGLDLHYRFARHGQAEPEEAYLRYYLRLADDWDAPADGGKLPGLAGTYGRAGWGHRVPDGSNGWSMRAAFAQSMGASMRGRVSLAVLACHGRVADSSCETWGWGAGPGALLEKNRWYAIEQRVKLNTPGKADGVFEAWVDGRQVARHERVLYRDTPQLKLESAWMNVYHGGSKPAAANMTLYIDAVVVARSYIGPLAGLPTPRR